MRKVKVVSSHGKPDRTRSGCLMRKGVTADLEGGRLVGSQAGKKRESVTVSSVACPHSIHLHEPGPRRPPSGASAEDELPA